MLLLRKSIISVVDVVVTVILVDVGPVFCFFWGSCGRLYRVRLRALSGLVRVLTETLKKEEEKKKKKHLKKKDKKRGNNL